MHLEYEETEPTDRGVSQRFECTEQFDFHGEPVERETVVQLLEDGGVAISQRQQGLLDSLTLGSELTELLRESLEESDE